MYSPFGLNFLKNIKLTTPEQVALIVPRGLHFNWTNCFFFLFMTSMHFLEQNVGNEREWWQICFTDFTTDL